MLSNGNLALRVRRVPGAARVGGEQTDWKGVLVASVAALLMITGMKFWSAAVPPPKVASGEAELIKPRPLVVRAAPPKPDQTKVLEARKVNQARRDPGKAVARHMDQEGMAGSKTAPRRNARAERRTDDKALVAQTGLLKALGGGTGQSDVFGIALEKGTRDAMGHLTGPRAGDARGDARHGPQVARRPRRRWRRVRPRAGAHRDQRHRRRPRQLRRWKGGLRGKDDGEIGLGPGKPEVVGSIDPKLIRRVVHEHRAQIRTCYGRSSPPGRTSPASWCPPGPSIRRRSVTEAHTQETHAPRPHRRELRGVEDKELAVPHPQGRRRGLRHLSFHLHAGRVTRCWCSHWCSRRPRSRNRISASRPVPVLLRESGRRGRGTARWSGSSSEIPWRTGSPPRSG